MNWAMFCLEAHVGLFRLLMKGIFSSYVLWPSSSMMGYSPIAKKSPIDQMGKNIWGKLMVFFAIRSIYLNYGENLCEKLMGKINGENLWGKFMGKINGKN